MVVNNPLKKAEAVFLGEGLGVGGVYVEIQDP